MSALALLSVALGILQGVLTSFGANDKYRKVASEIQAGADAISRARAEVLTNSELEPLRTARQW